jgi:nicotinamide mononucleotide (NMN) deamidase PncC
MPPYNPDFDLLRSEDILNNIKAESHKSAYKLCEYLHNESMLFKHKIATAESLTGGLIFSTLVDIPFYGYLKYGCFSVYDTDAKRIMLGVDVEDVYTRRCARQMAEGILRNSNATIGISVSGNAMAINEERERIGEVFIGVATYRNDKEIVSKTYAINTCNGTAYNQCKLWYETIEKQIELKKILADKEIELILEDNKLKLILEDKEIGLILEDKELKKILEDNKIKKILEKKPPLITGLNDRNSSKQSLVTGFNDFILTSFIASYIRAKTAHLSFIYALDFMKEVKKIPGYDVSNLQAKIERSRIQKDSPTNQYRYQQNNSRVMPCQSSPLQYHNNNLISECLDKGTCDSVRDKSNARTTAEFKKEYMSDRHIEHVASSSTRGNTNLLMRSSSPKKGIQTSVFPIDIQASPPKPASPKKAAYRGKSAAYRGTAAASRGTAAASRGTAASRRTSAASNGRWV